MGEAACQNLGEAVCRNMGEAACQNLGEAVRVRIWAKLEVSEYGLCSCVNDWLKLCVSESYCVHHS